MGILAGKIDTSLYDGQGALDGESGFSENFESDLNYMLKGSSSVFMKQRNYEEAWQPIVDDLNSISGQKFENPAKYFAPGRISVNPTEEERKTYTEFGSNPNGYQEYTRSIYDYIHQNENLFQDKPNLLTISDSLIDDTVKKSFSKMIEDNRQVSDKRTWGGLAGGIAGSIYGAAHDPVNIAAMVMSPLRRTSMLTNMFREFAINAGAEAVTQKSVSDWYDSLNLPYGYETFLANVAAAGGAGAVFSLGTDAIIKGIDVYKGTKDAQDGIPFERDPQTDAVITAHSIQSEIDSKSPYKEDNGNLNFDKKLDQSYKAIIREDYKSLPEADPKDQLKPTDINEFDSRNSDLTKYTPKDIKVDPEAFQFKAGGDAYGLTDRLEGVETWDPIKANVGIVYEKANGDTYIVDGHQRLGLAKRIMDKDPSQDIPFYAYTLRESDNITPEIARGIAAGKNIAEGSGTIIDAAKVLRDTPENIGILPPKSYIVQQAQDLSKLSDETFMAAVNDVIPAHYAAIIGRLVSDPDAQMAIMNLVKKLDPPNVKQAHMIIDQASRQGFSKVKVDQGSLFGDADIAESLYLERAKVYDSALKEIRGNKALFTTLVNKTSAIEVAGNKLDKLTNAQREVLYAKAIQVIENNANNEGAISTGLTEIARRFKSEGSKNAAGYGREFAERVVKEIERGDYARLPVGERVSPHPVAEEVSVSPELANEIKSKDLDTYKDGVLSKGSIDDLTQYENGVRTSLDQDQLVGMRPVVIEDGSTITVNDMFRDIDSDANIIDRLGKCKL